MNWMVFVVSDFHYDHKTMSEHLITGSKVRRSAGIPFYDLSFFFLLLFFRVSGILVTLLLIPEIMDLAQ